VYYLIKAVRYHYKAISSIHILLLFSLLLLPIVSISCVDKLIEETETYYETEYHTEETTETYTVTENVVVETKSGREYIRPVVKWAGYNLYGTPDINLVRYYGYRIMQAPHQRIKVKITLAPGALDDNGIFKVFNLTGIGQIPVIPTEIYPHYSYWSPNQIDWFHNFYNITGSAPILASAITGNISPYYEVSRYIEFDAKGVFEFCILADTLYYESVDMVQLYWEDDVVAPQEITRERQVSVQVPVQVEKQRTVQKIIQVPIWELFSGN
jgi:hypothetical protein